MGVGEREDSGGGKCVDEGVRGRKGEWGKWERRGRGDWVNGRRGFGRGGRRNVGRVERKFIR